LSLVFSGQQYGVEFSTRFGNKMWFFGGNCEFIEKNWENIRKKLDKPGGASIMLY